MKTKLLFTLSLLLINGLLQGQANPPTTGTTSIPGSQAASTSTSVTLPATTVVKGKPEGTELKDCNPCPLGNWPTTIAVAPLFLFILTLLIIFWKLKNEGYKIGDALKENQTLDISVDNPAAEENVQQQVQNGLPIPPVPEGARAMPLALIPPFVGKTVQPKSTSRLLAFLSGIISLGLGCCLCSFWLYRYFQFGTAPKLDDITNVLLTLGLGLIPYAFNKISTATQKTT